MNRFIFILLLFGNSNYIYANWTATIKTDQLTDHKVGIANLRPTNTSEIRVICREEETPQFAITWNEPGSATSITHFEYRVDKEDIKIINVNSIVGDRTTISTGSIMESIMTDLIKKNRIIVKGKGAKYETSIIMVDLDKSAVAIKKACFWHPFYKKYFQ